MPSSQEQLQRARNILSKYNLEAQDPGPFNAYTSQASEPVKKSFGGFVKNIGSSAVNLGKGLVETVKHPIETGKTLGRMALGAAEKAIPGRQGAENDFEMLTGFLRERYGSVDAMKETLYNDPVGVAADLSTLFSGGAAALKVAGTATKASRVTELGSRAARLASAIDPLNVAVKVGRKVIPQTVKDATTSTTRFLAGQATGLNPETIGTVIENPQAFTKPNRQALTRASVGQAVKQALDETLSDLETTGSAYKPIRELPDTVKAGPQWLSQSLSSQGWTKGDVLAVDPRGVSRPSIQGTKLALLSNAENQALTRFMDTWGTKQVLTADEFLDGRRFLDQWSDFSAVSTTDGQALFRQLRHDFDDTVGHKIPGLKDIDAQYGPQRQFWNQVKTDFLDSRTGELRDSALNRIANATGKGKDALLARLEELKPGITYDLRLLKAIEDIEAAYGTKVGTYTRTLTQGAGVAGLFTGNIPLIIGAVLTQPEVAVPLLRRYGITKQQAGQLAEYLRGLDMDALRRTATAGTRVNAADTTEESSSEPLY